MKMSFPYRRVPVLTLQVILEEIDESSTYEQIQYHFGGIKGVQFAGLNNPTRIVTIDYSPDLVSESLLLEQFHILGHKFRKIAEL